MFMELTTLTVAAKRYAYGPVLFTKPFRIGQGTISVTHRGKGKHLSYFHFAKVGDKIAWIRYNKVLAERLADWPLGCFVAASLHDEGSYILLIMPKDCERKTDYIYEAKKLVCTGIFAPDSIIRELESRLGSIPSNVFFASMEADLVEAEPGRKSVRVRPYFQIFDDIEALESVLAK